MKDLYVKVTEKPFCAKGDGETNDRKAIQSAIDYVYGNGGGTVELDPGKTFLSSGIVIKDNVTLLFGEGSVLLQSPNADEYFKPCEDGYIPYTPVYGHNFSDTIKWSHNWYRNYPFVFAPEGTSEFKITGNGIIRMMEVTDIDKIIKICPIGFYRCSNFEISDVHITNYHGYAMMPFTSSDGLIKNVRIDNANHGNGDGICLMNCRNIRVSGCKMHTGDDSLYIFSSYRDPRKGEWWSSDEPQASENIEIDHNDLISNHCKAFGMILWGIECPDLEKVEVRNLYIHDNHFETMGNWNWNPYTDKGIVPPVTSVRFENNIIDGIESNFFETQISDMNCFNCMPQVNNGNFEHGRCFWVLKQNSSGNSAKAVRKSEDGNDFGGYGSVGNYENGYTAIYQGVYLRSEYECKMTAVVTGNGRLFVRNLDNDELVSYLDFENADRSFKEFSFCVDKTGNYKIGLESGSFKSGYAEIRDMRLASFEIKGFDRIVTDNGKIIYRYNDNLFKRNQLKMYWLADSPLEELALPEGYSFSHYKGPEDIHVWNLCTTIVYDGTVDDNKRFKQEIFDFKDIDPFEDVWFLDYNGQHIGTATSFIYKSSGVGDMHWVGIHPDYRGKGLSKYLSNIVQKTLRDRGVKYISLTTGENRVSAVKSYLTAGFLPVEYAEGMIQRWMNVLRMFNMDSIQVLNEDATPFGVIKVM